MKPNDAAIRKRSQIASANKTMFLWIAGASAIVGVALVVSIFLFQKLVYAEKVLAAKQETVSILDNNNKVATELQDEIRVLDTNQALSSVKANPTDQAIQVILDALPSEANSFALGSSLQNKLLVGINGLSIESLQVDPVIGVETLTDEFLTAQSEGTDESGESGEEVATEETGGEESEGSATSKEITFQFVVKGSQDALRQVLDNLERSIRTIVVTSVRIETQATGPEMTVQGKAFYEPSKTVELRKETVKP